MKFKSDFLTFQRLLSLLGILMALVVLGCGSTAGAAPVLSITPITWNVIGLDSNDVTKGPDTFPVGARICNTGDTAATGLVAKFFFDSSNTTNYINLQGLQQLNLGTLGFGSAPAAPSTSQTIPANCIDAYFNVIVTRDTNAYSSRVSDTATPQQRNTRLFHIEASATGVATLSTPTPRELYVEKLISQNRNSVASFTGPSSVAVGQVVQYTLNASTATQGYEQLINFPVLPNSIFQVLNVSTTYAAPPNSVNNIMYANACGWQDNITAATYHNNGTCIGPTLYGGKVGGNVTSVYTVKIISGGTAGVYNAIDDFSGSSYHYNSDYGTAGNGFQVTASSPDLTLTKTHTGTFAVGTPASFTFTVTTTRTDAYGTTTVSDSLPSGLSLPNGPVTVTGPNASSWSCTSASNVITCTSTNASAAALISAGNSSTFTVNGIVVGSAATPSVTNTATVSNPTEAVADTTNNTASDTATVGLADLTLLKTGPKAAKPGQDVTYTLTVSNSGSSAAQNVTISDPVPSGTTFKSATAGGILTSGTVNWAVGTLASGSSATVTVTLTMPNEAAVRGTTPVTSVTNTATASTTTSESSTTNNTGSVTTPLMLAELVKSVRNVTTNSSFAFSTVGSPNDLLEYCVVMRNLGGLALPNFVMKDDVPANVDALTASYGASDKGVSLTRGGTGTAGSITVTGGTTTLLTSSSTDADGGSLTTSGGLFGNGLLTLTLSTPLSIGESASGCFRTKIR